MMGTSFMEMFIFFFQIQLNKSWGSLMHFEFRCQNYFFQQEFSLTFSSQCLNSQTTISFLKTNRQKNQVLRFSIVHDLKLTHSRVNKTMENVGSNHETISKCDILCKCRRTVIRISNNFTNTCLKYTCGSCFYLQSLKGTIIKKVLVKTHGENSFELFSLFINC